jgi:glycosyltransferase involved in cell wall biosynthesis
MSGETSVSVIVPVRNRKELLADLLVGLDKQTRRDFEVIVVDDDSSDGSGDLARRSVVAGRPVHVVHTPGGGAVAARRAGVRSAAGTVLAFTDSDCVPAPCWLEHAMAAIEDGAELVNGLTRPSRPHGPLERSVASGTEGLYPTCNVFYTRDLYDRVGGFDLQAAQRFGFRPTVRARGLGFGEDTLLAWRAARLGVDVRYVPEAVVEHYVFAPELKEVLSRLAQTAAFPALVKEVPELRRTLLWHGIMLGNSSRLPIYVMVLAAVTRRPKLMAAVLVWWSIDRLRRSSRPLSERLTNMPIEMALDVATSSALVAGSVRAGSAVL